MNIYLATEKDAETLALLIEPVQKIHADAYPHLFKYPIDREAMAGFFRERLGEENNSIFIAELDGKPAGYVVCILQKRSETLFHHPFNRVLVDQISVNPDCQGQGVGERLMQTAEEFARQNGAINLDLSTWGFNSQAHRFFERMGYVKYRQNMWKTLEV